MLRWIIPIAAIAVPASGCSNSASSQAKDGGRWLTFTCCTASDINRVYHPGDVVAIHWLKSDVAPGGSASTTYAMTLDVSLEGGFAGPAEAKALGVTGVTKVSAQPQKLPTGTTSAPLSRLRIPVNAKPGLYNLVFMVATDGSSVSGAGLIRVGKR